MAHGAAPGTADDMLSKLFKLFALKRLFDAARRGRTARY